MPSIITCAVTGARGYIGSHVSSHLERAGHKVLRLGRSRDRDDRFFVLGDPVDPSALEGADALVHCAYDFGTRTVSEENRINVNGSLQLLRAAQQAGTRRVVFISTVSAFEGCRSFYGQGKLEVERAVLAMGGIVLRPGLVYGEPGKGMFGALSRLTRLPLLPVFDGGRQSFVLVHVDDLARTIVEALEWEASKVDGPVVLAHPEPMTFADILRCIAGRQGRRLRTVSIPGGLGVFLLRLIEKLGLSVGFRSDSLVSLLNVNPALDFALTERLGLRFRRFAEADPAVF
jgi:nucleoside-diphosphate-sugar epimerase